MAGTKEGARKARDKNLARYGKDYYKQIGKIGGHNGYGVDYTGGFAAGEEGRKRARVAGKKGGQISKRRPAKK